MGMGMGMGPTGWTVTGDKGELQVGYQWAAYLGNWNLTCKQASLGGIDATLMARVVAIDTFWSTQLPIQVRLWMGTAWWVWDRVHVLTPITTGATVEMQLVGNPTATV